MSFSLRENQKLVVGESGRTKKITMPHAKHARPMMRNSSLHDSMLDLMLPIAKPRIPPNCRELNKSHQLCDLPD